MSRERHSPSGGGSSRRTHASPAATEVTATRSDADKSVRAPNEDQPRLVRLAEENQRLASENHSLKAEQRSRAVSVFLAELREAGQLTPAMELAGAGDALACAEESAAVVQFPDGSSAPLAAVLRAVLKAIPPSAHRRDYSAEFEPGAPATSALSENELRIAATLGLSSEEYASLKEG